MIYTLRDIFDSVCESLCISSKNFSDKDKLLYMNNAIHNYFNVVISHGHIFLFSQVIFKKCDVNQFTQIDLTDSFVSLQSITCYDEGGSTNGIDMTLSPSSQLLKDSFSIMNTILTVYPSKPIVSYVAIFNNSFALDDNFIYPYSGDIDFISICLKLRILEKYRDYDLYDKVIADYIQNITFLKNKYQFHNIASNMPINMYGSKR